MLCFKIVILTLFAFMDDIDAKGSNKIIISNNEKKTENDKASKCIAQIVKDHISCKSIIFIVSSSSHSDFLIQSINEYYCSSIITRYFSDQRSLIHPDAYLISVNNATDFLKGIHETKQDLSWNPQANFVIHFEGRFNEVTEIFQELINLMILKVVLLIKANNHEWEGFTYYLHNGRYCSRNASNIRSLGYCPKFSEKIFPNMIQSYFANCTLIVAAKEEIPMVIVNNTEYRKYLKSGAEQFVLEIIAKQVGIHLKYIYLGPEEHYGVILPNRTVTGLLGYLQRHEVNIAAGGLLLSAQRTQVFDYVYGYSFTGFSVITPYFPEKRWSRVYKQFSGITWLLIILSFFIMLLVILITKAMNTGKSKDEFLMILKLWRYFYGHADIDLFKDRYVKRFLIVWVIFTSCIYAFYNTASYSLITGHVQDKIKINHSDLAALLLKPCVSDIIRVYFYSAYNESFPENDVNDDPKCQSTDMVYKSVATRHDLYTVEADYTYYLRAINYIDDEGEPKINKWDYPRTDISSIFLTRHFPLTEIFQKFAEKIYETGLLQKHLSHIYSRKLKPLPKLQKRYNAIRLEDFRIHYCVLLIGSSISLVSFIMEYKIGNKVK